MNNEGETCIEAYHIHGVINSLSNNWCRWVFVHMAGEEGAAHNKVFLCVKVA